MKITTEAFKSLAYQYLDEFFEDLTSDYCKSMTSYDVLDIEDFKQQVNYDFILEQFVQEHFEEQEELTGEEITLFDEAFEEVFENSIKTQLDEQADYLKGALQDLIEEAGYSHYALTKALAELEA